MSRTYRKYDSDYGNFRRPRTRNEIRQLDIEDNYDLTPQSKSNRKRNRKGQLPTSYDDLQVSARHEDWDVRHDS